MIAKNAQFHGRIQAAGILDLEDDQPGNQQVESENGGQ